MLDITAIVLASGSGLRVCGDIPKQFMDYNGKPLLEWSLDFFNKSEYIKTIVLVLNSEYIESVNEYINLSKFSKLNKVVAGGSTRQRSSMNGLAVAESEYVLIHDAARPTISEELMLRLSEGLSSYEAVVPCISETNTVYQLFKDGVVESVLDRSKLGVVQTPQAFKKSVITKAHELAEADSRVDFTDDAGLVIHYAEAKVKTVLGDVNNIKVTYQSDF